MIYEQSQYCPHCGREIDPGEKHLSNEPRIKGWTEEIVRQAALETGFNVYTGPTTHGNSPARFVGIWTNDERDHTPFWLRARELIEETCPSISDTR